MVRVLGVLVDVELDPEHAPPESAALGGVSSPTGVAVSDPTSSVSSNEKPNGTVGSIRPSFTFAWLVVCPGALMEARVRRPFARARMTKGDGSRQSPTPTEV